MDHFTNNGHLTDEALALYAEALKLEQLEQLPEALREHLDSCSRCQEQAMALYALIADQDYGELGPHPTFGQDNNRTAASTLKMWFRPLLLLLMAVMAFFLFLQQQRQKEKAPAVEENIPADSPSTAADSLKATAPLSPPQASVEAGSREGDGSREQDENQKSKIRNQKSSPPALAANFIPSEQMESLVGTVTRSEGLSEAYPPVGAEVEIGKPVVFSWQTAAEGPFTVRLLDNRDEEVFSSTVAGNRLSSLQELEPGLYYWKLETPADLLFVGKFLVNNGLGPHSEKDKILV